MEKSIAKGTFEVKMNPQSQEQIGLHTMGRYLLDKQFSGDLEAISTVEMLAAGTENGAGAYVAIERVTGKLNGREGTFIFNPYGYQDQNFPGIAGHRCTGVWHRRSIRADRNHGNHY